MDSVDERNLDKSRMRQSITVIDMNDVAGVGGIPHRPRGVADLFQTCSQFFFNRPLSRCIQPANLRRDVRLANGIDNNSVSKLNQSLRKTGQEKFCSAVALWWNLYERWCNQGDSHATSRNKALITAGLSQLSDRSATGPTTVAVWRQEKRRQV